MRTWIIVAEASRAKLFETDNNGADLRMVHEFRHPDSRKKTGDLTSDKPGRAFDSVGRGRHAEEKGDAHVREQQVFAHELAVFLDKARSDKRFDHLMIMAGPRFLGELRQSISIPLKKCVTKEVDKDLAGWVGKKDLKERITELFS
ncbi:MAG: host attachment protein [Deltaproteobacteria bacterium]|nr:host attachment protein [Deltaproteobacteria bacterium]